MLGTSLHGWYHKLWTYRKTAILVVPRITNRWETEIRLRGWAHERWVRANEGVIGRDTVLDIRRGRFGRLGSIFSPLTASDWWLCDMSVVVGATRTTSPCGLFTVDWLMACSQLLLCMDTCAPLVTVYSPISSLAPFSKIELMIDWDFLLETVLAVPSITMSSLIKSILPAVYDSEGIILCVDGFGQLYFQCWFRLHTQLLTDCSNFSHHCFRRPVKLDFLNVLSIALFVG